MNDDRLPRLFGSATRSRYLLFVALNGGLSISEIARRTRIDKGHVVQMTRRFSEMGIASCSPGDRQSHLVSLNRVSPLYRRLRALLLAMGEQAVGQVTQGNRTPVQFSTIETIFGSEDRTKTLALLARLGSATIVDLSRLTGIAHNSMRCVLAHFVGEGALRLDSVPPHVYASFDERFVAAPQLLALCRQLGYSLPHVPPLAQYQRQRLRAREPEAKRRGIEAYELIPFGRPTQGKILLALSQVGAIRTRDLAIVVDMTQDSVRGISESLLRSGLAVCRTEKGGRNTERWYSLNRLHPDYVNLARYLRAIAKSAESSKRAQAALRRGRSQPLPGSRGPAARLEDLGSDYRFSVLRSVAKQPRRTAGDMAKDLDLPLWRTRNHLRGLAATTLIRYKPIEGQLRAEVNTHFRYARVLTQLLKSC